MILKRPILRCFSALLGRHNLYRLSRFLMNGARGDVLNDPATNGEKMVQEVALSLASPAVVFDVGANLGDWTASLLSFGKPVSVHAFEPCEGTYECLSQRIRDLGWNQVTPVKYACSREHGMAKMSVYGSGAGTNTLAKLVETADVQLQDVQVTTIDEYCRAKGITFIDLLKVDAEGCDFEVIYGAQSMVRSKSIRILQFEYNHRWIGARNFLIDVFSLLNPMGYQIGKLVGPAVEFYPHWHWELETFSEGNYIACTEETAQSFPRHDPCWLFRERSGLPSRSYLG
jgi:FkbM family methyltransferase